MRHRLVRHAAEGHHFALALLLVIADGLLLLQHLEDNREGVVVL